MRYVSARRACVARMWWAITMSGVEHMCGGACVMRPIKIGPLWRGLYGGVCVERPVLPGLWG